MKLVSAILAAVVVLGMMTGCGKSEQASAESKPVTRTLEQGWQPPDHWEAAGPDVNGKTPEQVVSVYLTAKKAGDWQAAWDELIAEDRPPFETWRDEQVASGEKLQSFSVGESKSGAPGVAVVEVSWAADAKGAAKSGKGEWWTARVDQDGAWKVTLQPAR